MSEVHMFNDECVGPVCPTCGDEITDIPFEQTHMGALISEDPFEAACVEGHNHTYQYDEAWENGDLT